MYNSQKNSALHKKCQKTLCYGSESLSSLALRTWELIPNSRKNVSAML